MKTPEDVIKGLEYLSDEDKEKILEARGLQPIHPAEVSARQQAKIDREDARKAEERKILDRLNNTAIPQKTPAASTMKLHINIQSYGKNGDAFTLEGDVFSQDDLAAIHDRFRDYMPRRKWWNIITGR